MRAKARSLPQEVIPTQRDLVSMLSNQEIPESPSAPVQKPHTVAQQPPLPRFMHRLAPRQPPRRPQAPPPKPVMAATLVSAAHSLKIETLSKIDSLLSDPTIATIECPGPGLPLMISRGGFIQSTPINFTPDEIGAILREISEKTRIPLTAEVFKAALGEFILTAVLSEFTGSRFIIQKKGKSA